MKLFNSLSKKKEDLKPKDGKTLKFYSCGPTTYDYLHIGNARALVVGDTFYRVMKALGYEVTFVRNFTDVDDKIIQRAKERGVSPSEHAEHFVQECLQDMTYLNLLPASVQPKVTETIPEIIQMIQKLLDHGAAYVVDSEVLFHVPAYKDYGQLSRIDWDGIEHGHRVEVQSHKKHPSDFVLWKPDKNEGVGWDSPWGYGRPGWHIECSAMAKKFLGDTIDIHHGGVDLLFPHHENEMAQSVCANQKEFCSFWGHHEFVNFQDEKMSKSLGNVVTIRQFIQEYSGLTLRYIFLMSHYRTKIDWTPAIVLQAHQEVLKIQQYLLDWQDAYQKWQVSGRVSEDKEKELLDFLHQMTGKMKDDLSDDINTPAVWAHFYAVWKRIRKEVILPLQQNADSTLFSAILMKAIREWLSFSDLIFGVYSTDPKQFLEQHKRKDQQGTLSEEEITKLIVERVEAKKNKDWKKADHIRDYLKTEGIALRDHPDGTITRE